MTKRCDYRAGHDPITDRPTGDQCEAPATHLIVWLDGSHRFSFGCEKHLESETPHRVELIRPSIEIEAYPLAIGSDDPPSLRIRFGFMVSIDPGLYRELHTADPTDDEFWSRFAAACRMALGAEKHGALRWSKGHG